MEPFSTIVTIGLDITASIIHAVALKDSGKPVSKSFVHSTAGLDKLATWLMIDDPGVRYHFCTELGAPQYEAVALHFAAKDEYVSLIDPVDMLKLISSEDKARPNWAKRLAEYGRTQNPPVWQGCSPDIRAVASLLDRLHEDKKFLHEQELILESGDINYSQFIVDQTNQLINSYNGYIKKIQQFIYSFIEERPELKQERELLSRQVGYEDLPPGWLD